MPLTILSVAYPLAPVSFDAAGGAEQILAVLDRSIVEAGHRSIVVAQAGSKTHGELIETASLPGPITNEVRAWITARHQQSIERAFASFPIDLVHFHGLDFPAYRLPRETPVLATLHLPPTWYPAGTWKNSWTQLVCVSESQRKTCPPLHQRLPVIPNGVPLPPVPRRARSCFAVTLGRICPEKNFHAALDAGTLAGTPVVLGGAVFPYPDHERYFRSEILPRLNGFHHFAGQVGLARKQRLLALARCLLLPTLAPETSSLVAMEAMAAGTPVIAFPSGAIPEIVEDGVTGFLVRDEKQMAAAIRRCHQIVPDTCRQQAADRFSQTRMVREYLTLYESMAHNCRRSPESYDEAG